MADPTGDVPASDVRTERDAELERIAAQHQADLDALAARRFKVGALLTVAMLVVYFGFILLIAFNKSGLGELVTDGLSWGNVVKGGEAPESEQVRVARISIVIIGAIAILLGIALEGQNVAFMVGLAFAIAASANLPALAMAIFWRRFTTPGAVASILAGTISALVLIYLSPTFQVDVLGNEDAPISLKNPALISMPLAFAVGIVTSLLTRERAAEGRFIEAERQIHLGAVATSRAAPATPVLPEVTR